MRRDHDRVIGTIARDGGVSVPFVAVVDTCDVTFDGDPWDPADPRNRDRTREARREIRRLLVAWDPIGVADTESDDEYDFMIGPLMHMLFEGTNEQELLGRIAADRDYMGLSEDMLGADRRLAAQLLQRWAGRHRAE